MPTDAELLRRYVDDESEEAFAELVRRHLDLVYSTALRRSSGRHALAEDIAQKVFSSLAKNAAQLTGHPALTGWLHRCTRNAAVDTVRSEFRRQKLAETLTAMHIETSPPEAPVDWDHLRPVIDDALDQLKERDREIMLLRFFKGLTFGEVGAKLNLTENAARMRTERALEKLRAHLGKRGVTSSAAALSVLLTSQSLVAAPAGLAASVTSAALTAAPTGGAIGVGSILLMSKLTTPIVGAALAAGLTAIVWTSVAPGVSAKELAALREENIRLNQVTTADASSASITAVTDEFAAQAAVVARAVQLRHARWVDAVAATAPTTSGRPTVANPRGHRDHGQATAHDAMMTGAWAMDAAEIGPLAKLIWFEGTAREKAVGVWATMPESIRTQYPTPEELYAFFLAAQTQLGPPPGADILEHFVPFELSPGRVAFGRPGSKRPQSMHYQQTVEGWKLVIPEPLVDVIATSTFSNYEAFARLGTP